MSGQQEPGNPNSYAGDKFWLALAAETISSTHPRLTRQAERLGTTVAWLWTAYMAFLALRLQTGAEVDLAASLPCALLVIAYVLAVIAAGPTSGDFDPRSPNDVRLAFNSSTRRRRRLLALAQLIVAASSLFVAYGVLK